jgi:hypothetical protein
VGWSVSLEEKSVIGVVLVLFGITWIGFAAVQPIPVQNCGTGGPACGAPGTIAVTYYALGAGVIVIGLVLLIWRLRDSR